MTEPASTPAAPQAPAQPGTRKAWATPALARIDSSDAEFGANPAQPEGLGRGS